MQYQRKGGFIPRWIPSRVSVLCLLAAVAVQPVWGQGSDLGTIRGAVIDQSGARIPSAVVSITDVATLSARKLTTNEVGEFEATGLKSGTYRVTFEAKGFNRLEVASVVLRPGDTIRVDGRLEISRASEIMTVTEVAPVIQTENPTVGATLDNAQVTSLPRDSRDYTSFLYLSPNITQGPTDGSFKFLGAQSYGASFSLDGQRTNGGVFGQPTTSQPSLETIGELTVLSNTFTAEYAGIANIRLTTRRGGTAYRGSLFYDNRNSALAAWSLNDKNAAAAFTPTPAQPEYPYPRFNQNEFGGSFGGPVPKVKNTYFFMAYERLLRNSPVFIRNIRLPHPTLLAGDFTRVNDSIKPLVPAAVTLTPEEIAQNTLNGAGVRFTTIPQRLLNPVTRKLIQLYFPSASPDAPINPANGRLVEYATNIPGTNRRHLGTLRVDHDFREKDRLYVIYNAQSQSYATSAVVAPFVNLGLT